MLLERAIWMTSMWCHRNSMKLMELLRDSFWSLCGQESPCTNTSAVGCSPKVLPFALVIYTQKNDFFSWRILFVIDWFCLDFWTGLTFNGVDEKGVADWTGCSNIKLLVFENTRRFQHYIDSFNVQTNHWIAEYVYKRLRFLNNRNYSQLGALIFLALWHGFHSGYYITFALEFAVIICEREVRTLTLDSPSILFHLHSISNHFFYLFICEF